MRITSRHLLPLLTGAILLPTGAMLLFLLARLFAILEISLTATILDGAAMAVALLWLLDLTALLFALGLRAINEESTPEEPTDNPLSME